MKTPKKANAGAYLAIAQQAKGIAPNAVDALDRKIARKLDGPKYSDDPLFAEKGIMIKGIGARKIENAIKENLSKNKRKIDNTLDGYVGIEYPKDGKQNFGIWSFDGEYTLADIKRVANALGKKYSISTESRKAKDVFHLQGTDREDSKIKIYTITLNLKEDKKMSGGGWIEGGFNMLGKDGEYYELKHSIGIKSEEDLVEFIVESNPEIKDIELDEHSGAWEVTLKNSKAVFFATPFYEATEGTPVEKWTNFDENPEYMVIEATKSEIDKIKTYLDLADYYKKRVVPELVKSSKKKMSTGGTTIIDETGSNVPSDLVDVFNEFDEDADSYKEMERLKLKANELGYDFDYDLSGGPTEFWKLKTGGYILKQSHLSSEEYQKAKKLKRDL